MTQSASSRAGLFSALAVAAAVFVPGLAQAGECPAAKVLSTPQTIENVTDASRLKGEVVNTVDPSG